MTRIEANNNVLKALWSGSSPQDPAAVASLWNLLQGFALELDRDTEPYEVISEFALRQPRPQQLTELVGAALAEIGTDSPKLHLRARGLYNILHLATELRNDRLLGEGVWRLYDRRIPQEKYKGALLTDALLGAMTYNQPTNAGCEKLHFWLDMIRGRRDEFVGGSPRDGFRGAIRSISVRKLDTKQRLDKLGEIVRMLYQYTDRHAQKAIVGGELKHLLSTYPSLRLNDILEAANLILPFTPFTAIQAQFRKCWPREVEEMDFLRELMESAPLDESEATEVVNRAYMTGRLRLKARAPQTGRLVEIVGELWRLLPHHGGPVSLEESKEKAAAFAGAANH